MTTAMLCDRLVIGNDVAELRRMAQWLAGWAATAGIPKELVFLLDHAANEALANIISYAYADDKRHQITLELDKTAQGACLVIRDDGRPFNVLDAPPHQQSGSLDEVKIGGLGIHLIRCLMTRCEYRREDGINVLSLEVQGKLQPQNA